MILRDLLVICAAPLLIRGKSGSVDPRLLKSESLQEFLDKIEECSNERFAFYRNLAPVKTRGNIEILEQLDIDPRGKSILDIGPGYGEFLDKCLEMGAAELHFIELDPVFFEFNDLKGYSGRSANHLFSMKKWSPSTLDLIWVSGSINASALVSSWVGRGIFTRWLGYIDGALRPSGQVIIKPWFPCVDGKRCFDDIEDNPFSNTMFEFGYSTLPFVDGHNQEPEYPVSFFKKL